MLSILLWVSNIHTVKLKKAVKVFVYSIYLIYVQVHLNIVNKVKKTETNRENN
jgi:hypothetical protein